MYSSDVSYVEQLMGGMITSLYEDDDRINMTLRCSTQNLQLSILNTLKSHLLAADVTLTFNVRNLLTLEIMK